MRDGSLGAALRVALLCGAASALAMPATAAAADEQGTNPRAAETSGPATRADKSGYTLFNPVPASLLRDFNADRPSQTTTPYTVDAGHVQVEASAFTYAYDRDTSGGDVVTTHAYQILPTDLRVGLLDRLELDVMIAPYNQLRVHERNFGVNDREHGFGDTTLALKWNWWGDDGDGATAFGVVPFLTIPTSGEGVNSGGYQSGVIFPLSIQLPWQFNLGLQTEVFEANNSSDGGGQHAEFVNSAVLDRELFPKLDGYVEVFTDASREPHTEWSVQFDTGVSYQLTENLSIDAGVNIGVTTPAPDLVTFTGFSVRF